MILHEWLAFYSAFLNPYRSGVLKELAWLVPHETAATLASSVYTIQPCTMSLHAKCTFGMYLLSWKRNKLLIYIDISLSHAVEYIIYYFWGFNIYVCVCVCVCMCDCYTGMTCAVPWNSWSSWVLSYEKGLKEHPDQPYHAVYYEQLKQVRLVVTSNSSPRFPWSIASTHAVLEPIKHSADGGPEVAVFLSQREKTKK